MPVKLQMQMQIEAAYATWMELRAELERWDEVATRFREHEIRRQVPRMEIEAEKARLRQELDQLQQSEKQIQAQNASRVELEAQVTDARKALDRVEQAISQRTALDADFQAARQRQAEARAENPRLKAEMDQLKARIDQLSQTEGAACPLCGRSLETHDRLQLIDEIAAQGKEMGDRYRLNLAYLKEADQKVGEIEAQIALLSRADSERLTLTQAVTRLTGQIEAIQQKNDEWEKKGAPRMEQVQAIFETESYALDQRKLLAEIDDELKSIGYDAAAHDASRQLRPLPALLRVNYAFWKLPRAALQPLEREIGETRQAAGIIHDRSLPPATGV